jgi:hypothetical protein
MSQLKLGQTIQHNAKNCLVVRVIEHSTTLFEGDEGAFILDESYVQLKGEDGSVEFIPLVEEKKPFTKEEGCKIKGLEPVSWGKS